MNASYLRHLQQQLSKELTENIVITDSRQVFGGDINITYILTAGSNRYFIKCNHSAPPDMFQKEYNGLQLLKSKSSLRIPTPLIYGQFKDSSYLVMECLDNTSFTPSTWKVLGEGIAGMHKQTQMQFGLNEDNYIGSLPQSNLLSETWAEFYAEQRILPLMKKLFDKALCTKDDTESAEAICHKLSSLFPNEPPALLHGDLWNGNIMACSDNEVVIYDPAVYYGHREMDIAMTLLFGGFDSSFYRHYQDVYPLQNDWLQRVRLCQLYPLLFHLNLFGSGYYSRVKSILDSYK